jgi:hypothetical protein
LRHCAAAVVSATAVLAAGGCGHSPAATTATPLPTAVNASVASPGGALAGFLAAARHQDNGQVATWLATASDITDLSQLLAVYTGFGSAGGLFWEVDGDTVKGVTSAGNSRAHVVLSGDIVWCLGKAADDPAATCSVVSPLPGEAHTYAAVKVNGRWKVDIDINASSGLDHNPQASGTATAPTPS